MSANIVRKSNTNIIRKTICSFLSKTSDFVNKCKLISREYQNCMKFHIIFSGVYFLHKEQENGENKMKVEGIQVHYIFCKV